MRPVFALSLSTLLVAGIVAAKGPPMRSRPLGKLALDPGATAIAERVAAGAAKPRHRALYRILSDLYPYDRLPAPDVRRRAIDAHRANLAAALGVAPYADSAWISLGPTNVPGRMTALALHPTDRMTFWAAAADGGVWKTTDGAATWRPTGDFEATLSMGALLIDPGDPNILWAGSGEGNFASDNYPGEGVYKSTDGGESWSLSPLPDPFRKGIRRLDLDPSDRTTMLAASNGGALRSTDAGASWSAIADLPSGDWMFPTDIVRSPRDPAEVYMSYGDVYAKGEPTSIGGVFKSTDHGASWARLSSFSTANVGRIALAIAPSSPATLYAGVQHALNDNLQGFYRSTDAGTTWARLGTTPNYCNNQCWYDNALAVDPLDPNLVYAGGVDTYRSFDGGANWERISVWTANPGTAKYVHADQHHLLAPRASEIWTACDGGVFRSTDAGGTWSDLGSGLVTTQFYSLADPGTETQPAIGGLQDNGTIRFDGTPSWATIYGGDGGFTALDPTRPSTMLTEYVYLDILKSSSSGATWRGATTGISDDDRALFIAPFVMDPANPQRLLAGTFRVYQTTTLADSWRAISPALTKSPESGYVSALAFDPHDATRALAGTTDGNLQLGSGLDTTATWTNLTLPPLPGRAVRAILVDPFDSARLLVSYSGYDSQTPETPGHVFRSTDGGASWANVSGPLPDQPVRAMLADPDAPDWYYIGTDVGVYGSSDGGTSWWPLGSGLPFVSIHGLTFNRTLRRLRAASHGRGLWEVELPLPEVPHSQWLPVVARAPGANGTFFVTDLQLGNSETSTATASLTLRRADAEQVERTVQVPPGGMLALDDLLLAQFGLESAVGSLEIRSVHRLRATARIYNQTSAGTYGQFAEAVGVGSGPDDPALHLVGLEASEATRTNVGIVELAGIDTTVSIRVLGDDGSRLSERQVTVPANALLTISDLLSSLRRDVVLQARAEIRATAGGRIAAYASLVDNQSGDAVYLPARAISDDPRPLVLSAAARAQGAFGSDWRTDLVVANLGLELATIDVAVLPVGSDGATAPRTSFSLAAGETRRLPDVVGSITGGNGSGALWIEPSASTTLAAWARIYTPGAAGTLGQSIEAEIVDGVSSDSSAIGVIVNADYRTNAGLANLGGSPATTDVVLLDSSGLELARRSVTLPAYSALPLGSLAGWLPAGSTLDDGQLRLENGVGDLAGWISVIDNRTNDPTFVPMRPLTDNSRHLLEFSAFSDIPDGGRRGEKGSRTCSPPPKS